MEIFEGSSYVKRAHFLRVYFCVLLGEWGVNLWKNGVEKGMGLN